MAKQKRALPARKQPDRSRDDESLLLRSAESLGRVIGALQRQLDGASRRLTGSAGEVWAAMPLPGGGKATRRGTRKRTAAKSAGAKNMNGGVAGTSKKKANSAAARKKKSA